MTTRARAARHGAINRELRRSEAAASALACYRCRRAPTNGVMWSASRVSRADNRAKSAAHSACSMSGRLVLQVTKRAVAARRGTIKRQLRRSEAAAAALARYRCKRAPTNGVVWSASRVSRAGVSRADNRAKSAAHSACSVGGRLVLQVTKRARAARHGTINRQLRCSEAAAAAPARHRYKAKIPDQWRGVERVAS